MRVQEIRLSDIGGEPSLRMDAKYRFFRATGGALFAELNRSCWKEVPLCELLVERPVVVVKKGGNASGKMLSLIDLEDVEPATGKAIPRNVSEIGSDRISFDGWDVLTNRLRPYLGKTFIPPVAHGLLGSTEWIPMKAMKARLLPRVLQALLLCPEYAEIARLLMSGKNHPRISEFDLYRIAVPDISMEQQLQIDAVAIDAEKEAQKQEGLLRKDDEIVVEIIGRGLGLPNLGVVRSSYGKGMTSGTQSLAKRPLSFFESPLSDVDETFGLRFSARCLRPQNEFLDDMLTSVGAIRARRWLRAVRKGDQPDYIENGEIPVIKTGSLQNWKIDLTDSQTVSNAYFATRSSASVCKGQVVVAATGFASLGKAAVHTDEAPGLASVDLLVLDLIEKIADARFFVHFLRSPLGFFQMECAFTGTTNQIHIYQDHLLNLRVPDISKEKQSEIADEIDCALRNNEEIREKIGRLRLLATDKLRNTLGIPFRAVTS